MKKLSWKIPFKKQNTHLDEVSYFRWKIESSSLRRINIEVVDFCSQLIKGVRKIRKI